jgi:hypothetical protein
MHPTEPQKSSSKVWIIVGIIFVALILLGGVGLYFGGKFLGQAIAQNRARAEQHATKLKELEAQQREIQQSLKDSVDSHSSKDGMADRLAKFGKSAGEAAEASSGMEKKGLLVSQHIFQTLTPALAKYEAATKDLQSAHVTSPIGLDSREAIAARVKTVQTFGEANDGLKHVLESMETLVRQEAEKQGITAIDREEFVKGFLRSANLELNRTIRNCDTELVETLLKMLAVLDRDWGNWTAEGPKIRFTSTASAEEYNKLVHSVQEIAARQAAAQQELIRRTSKPTGTAPTLK